MSHCIGLISPGAMGASVGAAAAGNGHRVLWAGDGRSAATRARAERGSLEDCGTIDAMVKQADIVLSVCPPHDATGIADEIASRGFQGTYLEGNAISPHKTRQIGARLESGGAKIVDGGIIGGPAWKVGSGTTLYLSGSQASIIHDIFSGSPLTARIISDNIGAASALKMTFAAYTKGSTGLLSAILAVADKEGVRSALEAQWGEEFTRQTHQRVSANTAKAWRFAGEMREISETFETAGLPGGFHLAAAEVFERLAGFKDNETSPDIEQVVQALIEGESS